MPTRTTDSSEPTSTEQLGSIELLGLLRRADVVRATRAEQIAVQLEAAIAMGLLPEGTRLPSEAALAAALGTSQMTLRVALASLRTQGLIETIRGRGGGSMVREYPKAAELKVEQRLLGTGTEKLRDCGDLYAAIAGSAAELAAERADDREIQHLIEMASNLESAPSEAEFWRMASRFQIQVAVAAQSSKLAAAMLEIQIELASLRPLRLATEAQIARTVADCQAVTDAIQAHSSVVADRAAKHKSRAEIGALIEYRLQLLIDTDGDA